MSSQYHYRDTPAPTPPQENKLTDDKTVVGMLIAVYTVAFIRDDIDKFVKHPTTNILTSYDKANPLTYG